jgi:hypothetical protein
MVLVPVSETIVCQLSPVPDVPDVLPILIFSALPEGVEVALIVM